jgi:hypothetical protein
MFELAGVALKIGTHHGAKRLESVVVAVALPQGEIAAIGGDGGRKAGAVPTYPRGG